jgi:hypothetical protein
VALRSFGNHSQAPQHREALSRDFNGWRKIRRSVQRLSEKDHAQTMS